MRILSFMAMHIDFARRWLSLPFGKYALLDDLAPPVFLHFSSSALGLALWCLVQGDFESACILIVAVADSAVPLST